MKENQFETTKKIDDNGAEYWSSRELAKVLEYADYRKFLNVIDRAKNACENSKEVIHNHFVHMDKMVQIGQSLYLFELHNAKIIKDGKKYRLHFSRNDTFYDLAITDPLIMNITGAKPVTDIRRGIACVSLAHAFPNQFNGKEYHYKLVVMVTPHE